VGLESVTLQRKLREAWRVTRIGAALATVLGVGLLVFGGGKTPGDSPEPLERWSYDLPYLLRPQVDITNVALIYMDDASHTLLNQDYNKSWDRTNHAQLVRLLTQFGAKAIAFDVFLGDAGPDPGADAALAEAIRNHGRVILGADQGTLDYYVGKVINAIRPQTNLLANPSDWGLVQLDPDKDDVVRKHFAGPEDIPSLSWKMAALLGAEITRQTNGQRLFRWINYYGPHDTLPHMSYHKAFDASDPNVGKFFRDRVVFIGSATQSGFSGKRRDQFYSPYAGWGEPLWPGVDFHATQFLNLMRGDWLRRPAPETEIGLMILTGLLAGALGLLRPVAATFAALAAALVVTVGACLLVWHTQIWFPWLIIVAVQIPVGLACAIIQVAQKRATAVDTDMTAEFPRAPAVSAAAVSDYEMIRQIGSGSYGQVWLARSVMGVFRAVKIVDWRNPNDARFEREFTGLKKFEPISRAHEGLVDILHVGRNEAARHFYYVMELADSCGADPETDPEGYVAATLKTKLQTDGALQVPDCVRICLNLTSALAFLHEQGLVHRDIKPANIIFVGGQAKLADIGLVAGVDDTLSFVGTAGYIPPEGPGTPTADVYSLGKVLHELLARTSRDASSAQELQALRQVIDQACARNLAERYKTGTKMFDALRLACSATELPAQKR
jgi:CHASE2 domain-containing sensor protein